MISEPPTMNVASVELLMSGREATEGFVYVIVSCDDVYGPVKIGWALDPRARLRSLQTGTPHELRLLDVVPGSRRTEASIHAMLATERVRGEWFYGPETREIVLLLGGATAEAVRFVDEHGELPLGSDVLEAIGVPELPPRAVPMATPADDEADLAALELEITESPVEEKPDPDYIIVGETAGPPPSPTGHITWQRPMRTRSRGRRGSMR